MTISSIFIVLIVACQSPSALEETEIKFMNENEIHKTGVFHTYEVALIDKEGENISADQVFLYMNMERMNHPMTGTMEEKDKGKFALDLPLAMEGEWYAEVTVEIDGQEKTERFVLFAEGEMSEDYIRGYDADIDRVPE